MKIAHIVWCLDTGGVESMLVNIINEQVKHENVELYIINDRIFPPLLNKISKLCKIHQCKRGEGSKQIFPIIKLNIDICDSCTYFANHFLVNKYVIAKIKLILSRINSELCIAVKNYFVGT